MDKRTKKILKKIIKGAKTKLPPETLAALDKFTWEAIDRSNKLAKLLGR
jgi:hypothetical protein